MFTSLTSVWITSECLLLLLRRDNWSVIIIHHCSVFPRLSLQCVVNVHFVFPSAGLFLCAGGYARSLLSMDSMSLSPIFYDLWAFCVWTLAPFLLLHTHVHLFLNLISFCHLDRKPLCYVSADFSCCWHQDSWSPAFAGRLGSQSSRISDKHPWAAFHSVFPTLLASFQQDPRPSARPSISAEWWVF